MVDDSVRLVVTHADGRVTQWSPDELAADKIPDGLTWSSSIPGGFGGMSCSLLRRLDKDYPDQDLFDNVEVIGAGGRVLYEGRMQQFPRSHGAGFQITPGAVGWNAHLRDDSSFSAIIIDRDLNQWHDMPRARLANALTVYAQNAPIVRADASAPAVTTQIQGPWSAAATGICEAWYDAGPGNLIGSLRSSWTKGANVSAADVNWGWIAFLSTDETISGFDSTANLRATGPGTFAVPATAARRYAALRLNYNPVASASNALFNIDWTDLRVIGDHGLSPYGSGADEGMLASDVIPYILREAAPRLTYTTGTGGSIEPTTFAIPHLVWRTPTTADQAIGTVNAYHLYDWGVWENKQFFFRQPDPDRLCWEARLGEGAFMDADGYTAEQIINGVIVSYTDGAGTTKTVGPPGAPTDTTSASLEDTSADNPFNSHSLGRKWDPVTIGFPTTEAGAVQVGAAYLAERSLATRRGTLTLTGTVRHPTEGMVPVSRVRAGDWVRVTDLNGENADVPRKIIEQTYSHASRSNSLSLDNTVAKLDAILARVGIQTGIMTGGGF